MLNLYPYQVNVVSKIQQDMNTPGNSLVVMATGAGKSLIIAEIAKWLRQPILILQPSVEILRQNKEKLLAVVGEDEVGVYSASMNEKNIKRYTLATIGSVYRKSEFFKHFKLVVIDECFVKGTLVDEIPIEKIKVGDFVDSYNHKTGVIEKKRVTAVSKKKCPQTLVFTSVGKEVIISTANHPYYTKEKGYLPAEKLSTKNTLYAKGNISKTNQNISKFNLFRMWPRDKQHNRSPKMFFQENWKSLSQAVLFFRKKSTIFAKNDLSESDVKFSNTRKDVSDIKKNWPQASDTRGQWSWDDNPPKNIIRKIRSQLVSRIGSHHRRWIFALSLQDRHSKSNIEDSDRNRWKFPLFQKVSRSEKGQFVNEIGVESVKIQKQRSNGKFANGNEYDFVYNLEIEDNNNYFANGILVHNCHLVNHKKLSTMFMKFLKQIGSPKVVGLTATPYRLESWGERLKNGYILSHTLTKMINRAMNPFWSRIISVINTGDLIGAGYLCQPTYIDKELIPRTELKPNVSHTDFDMSKFQRQLLNKQQEILDVLTWARDNHKHTLVFCASVAQAEELSGKIEGSCVVSAKTEKKLRDRIVKDFKSGLIRVVFNVECLTTGFDFPSLDCVVVLRPTNSIRLHVQMLGRGVRRAEGKKTCDIVDMVGNVKTLGKIETVKVQKLETGWDIVSNTGTWHGKELYSYTYQLN